MGVGTSMILLRSIKSSLPSFYPLRRSHDKIFQALYHFSVLQATKSWAGPGNEANQKVDGRCKVSLVPRPFIGETAWQLTRVQTVYRYDVKEITAAPVQAMNIGNACDIWS